MMKQFSFDWRLCLATRFTAMLFRWNTEAIKDAMLRLIYYFWYFKGEYNQNICNSSATSCVACLMRLPSCRGLNDGSHPFPTKLWKPDFINCYKNRTLNITKCLDGYFHPKQLRCTTDVSESAYKMSFERFIRCIWLFSFLFLVKPLCKHRQQRRQLQYLSNIS